MLKAVFVATTQNPFSFVLVGVGISFGVNQINKLTFFGRYLIISSRRRRRSVGRSSSPSFRYVRLAAIVCVEFPRSLFVVSWMMVTKFKSEKIESHTYSPRLFKEEITIKSIPSSLASRQETKQ